MEIFRVAGPALAAFDDARFSLFGRSKRGDCFVNRFVDVVGSSLLIPLRAGLGIRFFVGREFTFTRLRFPLFFT